MEETVKKEMAKPIEEIREDIFLRQDVFKSEPWYDDFVLYCTIGVCKPLAEHTLPLRKALKMVGFQTKVMEHEGMLYVVPDAKNKQPRSKGKER